jgi:hypothetical protein
MKTELLIKNKGNIIIADCKGRRKIEIQEHRAASGQADLCW